MRKDRRRFVVTAKPEKREKEKKPLNKKALVIGLSVTAAVLVLVTVALCLWFFVFKKESSYFKTYLSTGAFTKVEKTLTLDKDVSVTEYDVVNDVFIIQKTHTEGTGLKTVTLYGLAGKDKVYVNPFYLSVISVRGDYAIVTQATSSSIATGTSYVGLIKFRGVGTENGVINISSFNVEYNVSNPEQFYFCGEYLCIMGDKETPSSQASYTSFYDYKSKDQLLLCFRARYGYDVEDGNNYTFLQYDNYVVAYNSTKAFFFDIDRDYVQGYLEINEGASFASPYSSDSNATAGLNVLYLGNGWFVRHATQTSAKPFEGYYFCYQSIDVSGNATLVFARTTTDFYNVKTGKNKRDQNIFSILEVANKYTKNDFAMTANSYNNNVSSPDDYPCMNPADMVKDGYSILYYFYRPNVDNPDVSAISSMISEEALKAYDQQTIIDIVRAMGKETYCVLDENANVILSETETMLPVVTIDGVGFETSDPYFDIEFGDAVVYTEKGKINLLYADGSTKYAVVGTRENCVTIAALDMVESKKENSDGSLKYGAATSDGKIIVDCVYERLSAFYGGYAIATKRVGDNNVFYRVDTYGNTTAITDLYMVKDGVYIFLDGEKCGLKTFAGEIVLDAKYDTISLSDNYMLDGKYQRSYAIVTSGNVSEIFVLE